MAAADDGSATRKAMTFRRVQRSQQGLPLLAVFCARQMQVLDLVACRSCEHGHGLSIDKHGPDIFQRCSWVRPAFSTSEPGGRAVPIASLMSTPAITVSEHADLRTVAALFIGQTIGALPVVDAGGRPAGVVTKSDVLRAYYEHEELPPAADTANAARASKVERTHPASVREVMSHVVFTLHPEADVTRAAAIMAHEGVHHVVVTGQDGRAIGIVSALDVMNWLARASGYVIAKS
jgi:CBS domain-containing protein